MRCQHCGKEGAEEVFRPGTYLCDPECLAYDPEEPRWSPEGEDEMWREAEDLGLQGEDKEEYVQREISSLKCK